MDTHRILIAGAASGIGKALALALAESGRTLILVDKDVEKLHRVAADVHDRCENVVMISADLSIKEELQELITEVNKEITRVDVLINNAGFAHEMKPIEDLTTEEFDRTFAINVRAPFFLTHAFLPDMKLKNSGMIINMASAANIWGYPNHALYAASKAALTSFTETVAQEVKKTKIKAISILPSRTDTPMNEKLRGKEESDDAQSAEFVASVVARIVSDDIEVKNGYDVKIKDGKYVVEENIYDVEL